MHTVSLLHLPVSDADQKYSFPSMASWIRQWETQGYRRPTIYLVGKKSTYKWIFAIQTGVQESMVYTHPCLKRGKILRKYFDSTVTGICTCVLLAFGSEHSKTYLGSPCFPKRDGLGPDVYLHSLFWRVSLLRILINLEHSFLNFNLHTNHSNRCSYIIPALCFSLALIIFKHTTYRTYLLWFLCVCVYLSRM